MAAFAREQFPRARRVTVLCGRGNNGGDGMMTARLLADAGLEVTTLLLGEPEGLKGDAAEAWRELTSPTHGQIHVVTAAEDLARHKSALDTDLIVDAVVGTGFKPPLKGLALAALEWMKASKAPVLAVDLPSGWPADATAADSGGAGVSGRCGDYIYGAEAGACVWTVDAAMGPAGGGGSDRVAGGGDCFDAEVELGRLVAWRWRRRLVRQRRTRAIRARAGGGRDLWLGRWQGWRAVDGGTGGAARRGGAGDGGGSGAGAGGGGGGCAGADDLAAGGERRGLHIAAENLAPDRACSTDGGQDGAGDRAGAGAVRRRR